MYTEALLKVAFFYFKLFKSPYLNDSVYFRVFTYFDFKKQILSNFKY